MPITWNQGHMLEKSSDAKADAASGENGQSRNHCSFLPSQLCTYTTLIKFKLKNEKLNEAECDDSCLSPGMQDQPGQYIKTPSLQTIQKISHS